MEVPDICTTDTCHYHQMAADDRDTALITRAGHPVRAGKPLVHMAGQNGVDGWMNREGD